MTYLRDVTLLVAVAAHDDALVLAGLGRVTLLVTVTANLIWAVAEEVAHLAALLTLDIAQVAWLVAVLGDVILRTACTMLASIQRKGHDRRRLTVAAALLAGLASVGAIASAVSLLVAVRAGDGDLSRLVLVLFAVGADVAVFVAIAALWNKGVDGEPSFCEALNVLLWAAWPAFGELGPLWLVGPLEGDHVLLVNLSLEVDDGVRLRDHLLLGDEVDVHLRGAEDGLELLNGQLGIDASVAEDGLVRKD